MIIHFSGNRDFIFTDCISQEFENQILYLVPIDQVCTYLGVPIDKVRDLLVLFLKNNSVTTTLASIDDYLSRLPNLTHLPLEIIDLVSDLDH